MAIIQENKSTYSAKTGFIFIFNLIVGAGALTIPHSFSQVGIIYGIFSISILAFISYISSTFVMEAMSATNAIYYYKHPDISPDMYHHPHKKRKNNNNLSPETSPLLDLDEEEFTKESTSIKSNTILHYNISRKVEMATMAEELFQHKGLLCFYFCTILYLFGDLAIYAVAVPKSLREITCPKPKSNITVWPCIGKFDSTQVYRLYVILFTLTLGPFAFGHVHNTRCIQFMTTIIRHISFGLMILLAIVGIANGEGRNPKEVLDYENYKELPIFFGVCIYSFMCHHSLPGLISPIKEKSKIKSVIFLDFLAVLLAYLILCCSAVFRFKPKDINDVYTLNFKSYPIHFFGYFLSLFPVFTLSTNFPVICITLRENLKTLFSGRKKKVSIPVQISNKLEFRRTDSLYHIQNFISNNFCTMLALLPPVIVALFTDNVSMLVGITGAYAGLGIQWIIPAILAFTARERIKKVEENMNEMNANNKIDNYKQKLIYNNPYASPFSNIYWIYGMLVFSGFSVIFITIAHSIHVK